MQLGMEKMARANARLLDDLSKQAARAFLTEKTPLNDSICKFAEEHSLNDECVKRVCELSNVVVDNKLFDAFQKIARQQKGEIFYPKFATADAPLILSNLRKEKTASVTSIALDDYDAPPGMQHCSYPMFSAAGPFEKIAKEQEQTLERPEAALNNLELLREELRMNKAASELKIDDCAHNVYQYIKQRVLGGDDIKDMYRAAVNKYADVDKKNRVKDLFQFAAQKLVDEGLVITRDRQAMKLAYPGVKKQDKEKDQLVTDLFETPEGAGCVLVLNGSRVNDECPLFSELDILVKQYDEADRYDKALTVIDDRVKYVKRKIQGI
jgi:hypothetical protein